MKQISLDDAVMYLRELMDMNKEQLLREARFAHNRLAAEKVKKADMILFAFERKFNSKAVDPTILMTVAKAKIDPFNATFTGTKPLSRREY